MDEKRKQIRDWMQAELQRMGHGAKGRLAEYLGIRADGITRMLNAEPGKETREVKASELVRMEEFFGKPAPVTDSASPSRDGLRPIMQQPRFVKVIGKVAANTWLDVEDMNFSYDDVYSVPTLSLYPEDWQFGLVVEGNCLNKIANDGDVLSCLNLALANEGPVDGDLVIVERKRYGGQMVQRTAKRLKRTAQGYELWPESTDPLHQDPILMYEGHGDEQVEIIGKVLWIMRKP